MYVWKCKRMISLEPTHNEPNYSTITAMQSTASWRVLLDGLDSGWHWRILGDGVIAPWRDFLWKAISTQLKSHVAHYAYGRIQLIFSPWKSGWIGKNESDFRISSIYLEMWELDWNVRSVQSSYRKWGLKVAPRPAFAIYRLSLNWFTPGLWLSVNMIGLQNWAQLI